MLELALLAPALPDPAAIVPLALPAPVATAPLAGIGLPLELFPEPAEPVERPEAVAVLVDASGRSPVDVADEAELQWTWLAASSAAHTNPQNVSPLDIARSLSIWRDSGEGHEDSLVYFRDGDEMAPVT